MSHYEDEEQVEQLRKWWKENWKAIAAGLVLGVGGILGWEAWQSQRERAAEEASRIYEEMHDALAADALERAATLADSLRTQHGGSPYAALAALGLARHLFEHGDLEAADAQLAWVLARSDDEGLRRIARLRKARVQWSMGRASDALKLLEERDAGPYTALFAELRGDILLSTGDRAGALAEYRAALAADAPAPDRKLLEQKVWDLADVEAS